MSEEKKNGSAASPAAGTVSHNLSVILPYPHSFIKGKFTAN